MEGTCGDLQLAQPIAAIHELVCDDMNHTTLTLHLTPDLEQCADRKAVRNCAATLDQTMTLISPVSSSSVMKVVLWAVPGALTDIDDARHACGSIGFYCLQLFSSRHIAAQEAIAQQGKGIVSFPVSDTAQ